MANLKPVELIELFEDLAFSLSRNSDSLRSLLMDAETTQRHVVEHQDRMSEQIQLQRQCVLEDEDSASRMVHATESASATCHESFADAEDASQRAVNSLRQAKAKLSEWQRERTSAEQALSYAQTELTSALAELDLAMSQESTAKSSLETAKQNFQACESQAINKKGRRVRNCASEESAVAAARQELERAKNRVIVATGRRIQAEQAVRAAEVRLERAIRCVETCEQAVGVAKSADEDAAYALKEASLASELIASSLESINALERLRKDQADLVEQFAMLGGQVSAGCTEAVSLLRQVNLHHTAIFNITRACRNDLTLRADDLRRLESTFSF